MGGKADRILFVVGRDDWIKGEYMSHMSLGGMRRMGFKIMWEEPTCGWIFRLRQVERLFPALPERIRGWNMRGVQHLFDLFHWGDAHARKLRKYNIEIRLAHLRKRLGRIGSGKEISILSYSSGGRVSSLIADSFKIRQIICIGYPFRNPAEGDNPERYRHLAGLKTPMMIIQGDRDKYGGSEAGRTYALSRSIELFFIESDHDYMLDDHQWGIVLNKIESALGPAPGPSLA